MMILLVNIIKHIDKFLKYIKTICFADMKDTQYKRMENVL